MLPAPMTPILMWNSSTTRRCTFAIHDPQSKIQNSQGGIAQLVERQLCKLEVRGSNPLASSLRSRRRGEQRPSRRNLGEGGLIGPCNVNAASYDSASRNTHGNVLR